MNRTQIEQMIGTIFEEIKAGVQSGTIQLAPGYQGMQIKAAMTMIDGPKIAKDLSTILPESALSRIEAIVTGGGGDVEDQSPPGDGQ